MVSLRPRNIFKQNPVSGIRLFYISVVGDITDTMRACSVITCEALYSGNDSYCPQHRGNERTESKKLTHTSNPRNEIRACSVISCENLYSGHDSYCPQHRGNAQTDSKKPTHTSSPRNEIRACSVISCENLYSGHDSYCPQHRGNAQTDSSKYTSRLDQDIYKSSNSDESKYVCILCGKPNLGGHLAKNTQKTIGNAIVAGGLGITILTGGLTALFTGLLPGIGGAAISGSAEKYSFCVDCRNK